MKFLIFFMFLVATSITLIEASASYGDSCYFTSDCNRSAELHCFNGRCTCGRPSAMLFDPTQSKCVSKAEEVCYYWTLKHWTEAFQNRKRLTRLGLEVRNIQPYSKPDCVANAYCSKEEGRCLCNKNFYKTTNGLCLPNARHLDPCQVDSHCQEDQGLIFVCLQGRCRCDPRNSFFEIVHDDVTRMYTQSTQDEMEGQCVGQAGSHCVNDRCTSRAYCSSVRSICKCQLGAMATLSGHCKSLYSHPCSSYEDCVPGLVCKDHRCSCEYADQLYDSKRRQCLSRVGEPCDLTPSPFMSNCIEGALCEPIQLNGPTHCVCAPGFVENSEGDCKASFKSPCNSSSECDGVASLVCLDNRCGCNHFARFSLDQMKCLGLVGSKCYGLRDAECIANAFCKQDHPRLPGHCSCNRGYFENSNYACELLKP